MNKKVLGIVYPIAILVFVLGIYGCSIVALYFMNTEMMFGSVWIATISIVYLIIFHVLLALIVYCYLFVMFSNPGEPPLFWVL